MNLADLLGDPPDWPDRRPWRPPFGCPCCGRGLGYDEMVFCTACELHREWCRPLKAPEVEGARRQWARRIRSPRPIPQPALW